MSKDHTVPDGTPANVVYRNLRVREIQAELYLKLTGNVLGDPTLEIDNAAMNIIGTSPEYLKALDDLIAAQDKAALKTT